MSEKLTQVFLHAVIWQRKEQRVKISLEKEKSPQWVGVRASLVIAEGSLAPQCGFLIDMGDQSDMVFVPYPMYQPLNLIDAYRYLLTLNALLGIAGDKVVEPELVFFAAHVLWGTPYSPNNINVEEWQLSQSVLSMMKTIMPQDLEKAVDMLVSMRVPVDRSSLEDALDQGQLDLVWATQSPSAKAIGIRTKPQRESDEIKIAPFLAILDAYGDYIIELPSAIRTLAISLLLKVEKPANVGVKDVALAALMEAYAVHSSEVPFLFVEVGGKTQLRGTDLLALQLQTIIMFARDNGVISPGMELQDYTRFQAELTKRLFGRGT